MPFHSIKPKLQVPNFYLILPLLNLNASNSSTTTLKKKKTLNASITTICRCCCVVPHILDLHLLLFTFIHELNRLRYGESENFLSSLKFIFVFFFFFSALLPCLCPLRFLGTSMSRDHSLYCVWLFVTFFVLYFYYFIYKGITLFELVSTA